MNDFLQKDETLNTEYYSQFVVLIKGDIERKW